MAFTTACIVNVKNLDDRKQLIEWLEEIGNKLYAEYDEIIISNKLSDILFNCGTNIELFRSLSAMNEASTDEIIKYFKQYEINKNIINKRSAYFGTNGRAGHYLFPLNGNFSSQEIEDLSDIDMVQLRGRGGMFLYKGFTCLWFPYSPDDKRPGSKSIVMVENGDINDIKKVIIDIDLVHTSIHKVCEQYGYTKKELLSIFGDSLID